MDFCKLNECELNFAISALANTLADGLDNDELVFLSRVLNQLSGALQLIYSFRLFCDDKDKNKVTDKDKKPCDDKK